MPKTIDLRVKGMTFDEAVRRLATTPPPEEKPARKQDSRVKRVKK
jgi:hypothetical protein